MSIDWIIASAVINGPDVVRWARESRAETASANYYQYLLEQYSIPPDVERRISAEVADPANYNAIWEALEDHLRRNPMMAVAHWRDGWRCVGVKRLQLHSTPFDKLRRVSQLDIEENRVMVAAMLATIYGGHIRRIAADLAGAVAHGDEYYNRYSSCYHMAINSRQPVFPDLMGEEEENERNSEFSTQTGYEIFENTYIV